MADGLGTLFSAPEALCSMVGLLEVLDGLAGEAFTSESLLTAVAAVSTDYLLEGVAALVAVGGGFLLGGLPFFDVVRAAGETVLLLKPASVFLALDGAGLPENGCGAMVGSVGLLLTVFF